MGEYIEEFLITFVFIFLFAIMLWFAIRAWNNGKYFDFAMHLGWSIYVATYIVRTALW